MSDHGGKTYRPWEPQRYQQEAHSPAAKLPEGDLVFFLLDTVPQLDLSRFYAPYEQETRGAPPFDPAMMVCLWLYAYCVGVFSSRKIAQACERNLAFMAIVGQGRPDFRTPVPYTHLRAHETSLHLVCRLLLDKKNPTTPHLVRSCIPPPAPLTQQPILARRPRTDHLS